MPNPQCMTHEERYTAKLRSIREHPEQHQHSFEALHTCCCIDGFMELSLMEAHRRLVPQRNPGGCDVVSGPCSCGAWH